MTNQKDQNLIYSQEVLPHEIWNSAINNPKIRTDLLTNTGKIRNLTASAYKTKEPCVIIGSGPSLDKAINALQNWTGVIICSSSQVLTLDSYGITPTVIVAYDP